MKKILKKEKRNPWAIVPSLYFAEGLPYILINNLSVVMLKSMGVPNDLIGYTSFLYLPWMLKFLWAPAVDGSSTKRNWILAMQFAMAAMFGMIAFGAQWPSFFWPLTAMFTIAAFMSATHDIAIDGYYLHALGKKDQAFFTGIRSTFYRIAIIFGSGILVMLAGDIGKRTGEISIGWTIAFIISAGLFAISSIYHKIVLPFPKTDKAIKKKASVPFAEAFKSYFGQPGIISILAYILLYRFGEGMLVKMAQPFIMDPPSAGGLGIGVTEVGLYYGTVGVIALVIGGILGGWLIKKRSLKSLIWPMALMMNLPNILYIYLASSRPIEISSIDLSAIFGKGATVTVHLVLQASIAIEQFGYGFGFTAFMVFLMYMAKGKYKTTHYAISTGIMALGMMLPGFLSGWLQIQVGYFWLFVCATALTLPGMATIFFIPLKEGD
jgi:PAT family beta-lactamase induction signal transducer AmpG